MIKLLKNAEIYNPEYIGFKDLLIVDKKIAAIDENLSIQLSGAIDFETIDCSGKLVVPGFIDGHIHLIGGGGEGGYKTRTPEIQLVDIIPSGITTVVGCLGTDGVSRNIEALYAKAKALEEEGLSAYIFSGSYKLPPVTITGDIMKDLMMIDKVIGIGEIALSDHRCCQPTIQELKHLVADARVGGILSGKAGIVCFHVGDGNAMLSLILDIIESTELTYEQFLPTHINRNQKLFEEGIKYAKAGGFIDFTTSTNEAFDSDALNAGKCLKIALNAGVSESNITFTSDAQGSLPIFDKNNNFVGLGIGKVSSLYQEFKAAVLTENLKIETALKPITTNPARLLKLQRKGRLDKGCDADIVILDKENLEINTVIATGKVMFSDYKVVVHGTFF